MPVAKPTLAARLTRCLAALFFVAGAAQANNLTVSNISLLGQNTVNDFILVEFDISWRRTSCTFGFRIAASRPSCMRLGTSPSGFARFGRLREGG